MKGTFVNVRSLYLVGLNRQGLKLRLGVSCPVHTDLFQKCVTFISLVKRSVRFVIQSKKSGCNQDIIIFWLSTYRPISNLEKV